MGQAAQGCCTAGHDPQDESLPNQPPVRTRPSKRKGARVRKECGSISSQTTAASSESAATSEGGAPQHIYAPSEFTSSTSTATVSSSASQGSGSNRRAVPLLSATVEVLPGSPLGMTLSEGLTVVAVEQQGPCHAAGVLEGWRLASVGDIAVCDMEEAVSNLASLSQAGGGVLRFVPTHSSESVAAHNTAESCWASIGGRVYDLTSFVKLHPGGRGSILEYAGSDATIEFFTFHSEPRYIAYLEKYCIGEARSQSETSGPTTFA
eukprot:TRINITY_DN4545_c1_g1_i1.p1 TRINITY_DN4545_c1_g1~~TRINITY_DN4545_c1_g1_i1.p1  ORF type:complete len:264 (+),score=50.95 TRINITY_DN4545_c1_g1_i1:306-1097(+)